MVSGEIRSLLDADDGDVTGIALIAAGYCRVYMLAQGAVVVGRAGGEGYWGAT